MSRRTAPHKFTARSTARKSRAWFRSQHCPRAFATSWPPAPSLGFPNWTGRFESIDGTRRYLLRLGDGRTVETVLMPEGERDTVCISSQVGCPVDCKFCMTALMGLERSLTAGEIVGQVLFVARDNGLLAENKRFNVVMMGNGRTAAESPQRSQGYPYPLRSRSHWDERAQNHRFHVWHHSED